MCLMLWFRAIWNCLPVLPFSPVRYPLQGPIRLQTKLRQPLTYVCMRMYICIFSYMHTYIHICIYVCICVHTHTHTEICMQVRKQQLELDMEQNWFQIGKGVCQGLYCHPAYLTYMQSTSWEMLDWMKHKFESRLPGEKSITSDTQMAESED